MYEIIWKYNIIFFSIDQIQFKIFLVAINTPRIDWS